MKIQVQLNRSYRLLLFVLLLVFVCCGCGTATATGSQTAPVNRVMPTRDAQPVSGQQLLGDGPVTYIALGASDAVGVGSSKPSSQGYVPLIAQRLPKGSRLVNLGISGARLHQAMQQELPIALSTSPKLVTIWLVVNDFVGGVSYDSYMRGLDSLLKQLRAGTHARIVMGNIPDLTRPPSFAKLSAEQKAKMLVGIKRWNANINLLGAQYHVSIVDLFAQESQLTAHPEYVSGDGFHPSVAGYRQLANSFWAVIAS